MVCKVDYGYEGGSVLCEYIEFWVYFIFVDGDEEVGGRLYYFRFVFDYFIRKKMFIN